MQQFTSLTQVNYAWLVVLFRYAGRRWTDFNGPHIQKGFL